MITKGAGNLLHPAMATAPLNILSFDFGASSGRAILGRFDGQRLSIQTVHQFPNGPVVAGRRMYWDVLRFVAEICEGIRKAMREADGPIASMGIDTWGVDFGLLDKRGELLGNPYHYRDPRTEGMFAEAFRRMTREEIFARTGVAFQPFNTLYQLLATRLEAPGILDAAADVLLMPDLLAYLLTGEKGTEYTDASTTQMLDATSRTWSTQILKAMDLPGHLFGAPSAPGSVRGMLSRALATDLGIAPFPVIAVAGHDTASAVVASPLGTSASAYLSSGTWSLLGTELTSPCLAPEVLKWNFTNEGGADGTYRLLKNVMGLWILQECKRSWDAGHPGLAYETLVREAEESTPFAAFIDPDCRDFYSPGEMESRIRKFWRDTGQRSPETRGALTRCIFESLAMKYRYVVDSLREIRGGPVSDLCIVGGGARNAFLNQCTANALAMPVSAGPVEATAVGNLLMQLRAHTEISSLADMRSVVCRSFDRTHHEPADTRRWDDAYHRWKATVSAGSPVSPG
jgi:rhamnulokinase